MGRRSRHVAVHSAHQGPVPGTVPQTVTLQHTYSPTDTPSGTASDTIIRLLINPLIYSFTFPLTHPMTHSLILLSDTPLITPTNPLLSLLSTRKVEMTLDKCVQRLRRRIATEDEEAQERAYQKVPQQQ